jgi:protein-L-isoaspartate O-methyltransferase
MKLYRLTKKILASKGLSFEPFRKAVDEACEGMQVSPPPQRILLCAALCYKPGGAHCDLGGGTSLYNAILSRLGMRVTVVDLFADHQDGWLDRMRELGITICKSDLYEAELGENSFDVISVFETIEHLPHSPKPILENVMAALKPAGTFVMSVPNIARIENRVRTLKGRNPMGKYPIFFREGNPFLGHHREMTVKEVGWLAAEMGLQQSRVFTTDHRYKQIGKAGASRWLADQNDLYGISDSLTPKAWRRQIWLDARRP